MRLLAGLVAAGLMVLLVGCGEGAPDDSEVLISLTDQVIVPTYQAAGAAATDLETALEALCAAPSDSTLRSAYQAWRDARGAWLRSAAMAFGPVADRRSGGLIDWSPIDPARIERMLAENPATTEDAVRNTLASTQRGFGAIEYIVFDPDAVSRLSDSASARCEYLRALGGVIASETGAIVEEWTVSRNGGPAYRDFLTGRSSSSMLESAAVAEVVRTQVFLIRTLTDLQLAAALGLRGDGPDLAAIPGGAGGNGLADLRATVLGMRDVYLGDADNDGLGVSHLVTPLSTAADERMRSQFEDALMAVDAVEGPLRDAVVDRPAQVRAVYDRVMELRRTLNTEVVSLLGVAVGFSDTDGDSMR
ncbi:MAG: imelysin family protein [Chloroflexi bacterium]|nr:imelysin family protein [Chloroflexota bacterium]